MNLGLAELSHRCKMDLTKIFSADYAKQNLPRAVIAGAILGAAFRFTLSGQTYAEVKDQIDDYATYMLADNFKDVLGAIMPAGEGATAAIAMFLPARMKLGNYIADHMITVPAGKLETDVVDPTALNIASVVVGGIAALAVYVSGDLIDSVAGTSSAKGTRISAA